MDSDTVWQNLFIIQSLKPHERINTCDVLFSVQAPGIPGGLYRRWYGERRYTNLGRLSDQLEIAMLRLERAPEEERSIIIQRIHGAMRGLQQLQITYAADAQAVAALSVIVDHIRHRTPRHYAPEPPYAVVATDTGDE